MPLQDSGGRRMPSPEYPSAGEATIMAASGPPQQRDVGGIPVELRRTTGVTRDPECGCHFDVWRFRYSLVGLGPDVELHVLQEVAERCVKGHSCRGPRDIAAVRA